MSATREKPAARPKPEAPKATPTRDYVVLVQTETQSGGRSFNYVGEGRGTNDIDAIRDATRAMSATDRSQPFVAIAKSRFKVRSRKVAMVERESWD